MKKMYLILVGKFFLMCSASLEGAEFKVKENPHQSEQWPVSFGQILFPSLWAIKEGLNRAATICMDDLPPLHHEAGKGNFYHVKVLIALGSQVDSKAKDGGTPLHYAAKGYPSEEKCALCIKELLDNCASIEARDNNECTPLHLAALGGKIGCVRELIDRGANMKAQDRNGWTPLHYAVKGNHLKICKLILGKIEDRESPKIKRAIGLLVEQLKNYKSIDKKIVIIGLIKRFIESKSFNVANSEGYTPLLLAVELGYLPICELLIDAKVGLDIALPNGATALHKAVVRGNFEMCKLLLLRGADYNLKDHLGKTPYDLIMRKRNNAIGGLFRDIIGDGDSGEIQFESTLQYWSEEDLKQYFGGS